jgi:hypothetical protein
MFDQQEAIVAAVDHLSLMLALHFQRWLVGHGPQIDNG